MIAIKAFLSVSGECVRAIQNKYLRRSSDPSHYSHNSLVSLQTRESFSESRNCSVILKIRPLRCSDIGFVTWGEGVCILARF